MRITRIGTDADGESRFDEIDIPLRDGGEIGRLSKSFVARRVMKRAKAGSDALLIATPEYNHGVPGVLKNAID